MHHPGFVIALIFMQTACAAVFSYDLVAEFPYAALDPHFLLEATATTTLIASIIFEISYLRKLAEKRASLERRLKQVSMEVQEIIEGYFEAWGLTAGERDVAALLIKGLDTPEIARIRGAAEGTVKAQLTAVYRKSGSRNRSDVLIHIIDALIERPQPSHN
jgi:DNA-binding CsgD family transcriptional regulator